MYKDEKLWINIIFFTMIILILIFTIVDNHENGKQLISFASILIASISVRYLFIYENEKYYKYGMFNILIDLVVIFIICKYDNYSISKTLLLVIIGDATFFYKFKFSIFITLLVYALFIITNIKFFELSKIEAYINHIFVFTFTILIIFVAIYVIKYLITQKKTLTKTMGDLKVVNLKLSKASLELEQIVKLKERNRVATQVHDTVGHTLTTVLVEIEAAKVCVKKNKIEALEKLELAEDQVRRGLKELINSVKEIESIDDKQSFVPSINKLIDEVEKHSNIKINTDILLNNKVPKTIGQALYKSLKEGVTNGIRHGKCTRFDLEIKDTSEKIVLTLSDNGCGCLEIKEGFGLKAISQRIKECGGIVKFRAVENGGFCMEINIPYEGNEINEKY